MTLEQLSEFFKWMTIINVVVLGLSTILVMILKNVMCRMHGKIFGIKEEAVAIVAYSYLGMCKVVVIVFNIVPYIALQLLK